MKTELIELYQKTIPTQNLELIPLEFLCEALGIDYSSQLQKIKDDDILCSTVVLCPTVGADGKDRDMSSIPLKYVLGWLFGISSKSVKEEIREALKVYKNLCYDALYNYFTEHAVFIEEKERKLNDFVDKEVEARNHFKNAEKLLREIRTERDVFRKTTFEEWKANNNQTKMDL